MTGWVYTENPLVGPLAFTARLLVAHICLPELLWLCLRYRLVLKLSSCTKKLTRKGGGVKTDWEEGSWKLGRVHPKPTPLTSARCPVLILLSEVKHEEHLQQKRDKAEKSSGLSREYKEIASHSLKPSTTDPWKVNCLGDWWADSEGKETCL